MLYWKLAARLLPSLIYTSDNIQRRHGFALFNQVAPGGKQFPRERNMGHNAKWRKKRFKHQIVANQCDGGTNHVLEMQSSGKHLDTRPARLTDVSSGC